jgi:hypothetical protein
LNGKYEKERYVKQEVSCIGKTCDSNISPEQLDAYKQTHYLVHDDCGVGGSITLMIGVHCEALANLHKKCGVDCSAFITACNPMSRALTDDVNAKRQRELISSLKSRSLRWVEGMGQHPTNGWPGEPSVLVLGLSLESAKVLAQDYEQNAFVWAGSNATPQLILMR